MRVFQALGARGAVARCFRPFVIAAHRWFCLLASMDLPPALLAGPGLAIVHGWGVVVNQGARIGRNVTLMQGVTIGRADAIAPDGSRATGYPVIGNDVWIGPGAVIVGDVNIGDGCRILANSVVTTDLPAGSMAGGIPAKVIKTHVPRDVVNPIDGILTA
jgi:serine O-acetyltransferase